MLRFTSSFPEQWLKSLAKTASELKTPKSKILMKALNSYLVQLDKARFAKSFKRACKDQDLSLIAEEGMNDYYTQLKLSE